MKRALAALGAALALAASLSPAPATATPGRPGRPVQEAAPTAPQLRLVDQPIVVAPDGDFGVLVAVADAPEAVELAVDIYDRAEPDDLIGLEPEGGARDTFPPVPLAPVDLADPSAERTSGFSIALHERGEPSPDPAWGYRLDDAGVYPIRIRLRDAEGTSIAVLMTAIVRLPADDETVTATQAALLVEGHRPPPADAEDRAAGATADASFVSELAPVLEALDRRPTLPATFSITPDTIARVAGDDSDEPTAVLRDLRAVLEAPGRDLLDAPYVDIDPTSLVRSGLATELGRQRDLGRQTLTGLLEAPVAGTWRLDPHLDVATLDELRQRGIFRTVVAGDVLTGGSGVTGPVEVTTGDTSVRSAAASAIYRVGAAADDDPVLAGHRLLARLAAAATDRDEPARILVDLDPATAAPATLDVVLDALAFGTPFFSATSVDAVLAAPTQGTASLAAATPPNLGRYPAELRAARTDLASYASMVGDRAELLAGPERTLAVSGAADLDLAERRADVDGVRRDLQEVFASIEIPASDTVTLGAREGTFPLPIVSSLDEPVKVVIQLESSDRLEFPDDRIETTLEDERTTVDVKVRALASGDTPVRITVRSPDDGKVLAESRYVVRSTAVSGVGILLTVGAAAFLAVWWGRHWVRARRARRTADPSPDPDPV